MEQRKYLNYSGMYRDFNLNRYIFQLDKTYNFNVLYDTYPRGVFILNKNVWYSYNKFRDEHKCILFPFIYNKCLIELAI